MKLNTVLLSSLFAVSTISVATANPAPVLGSSPNLLAPTGHASLAPIAGSLEAKIANIERQINNRNKVQVNVQNQLDELQREVDELRGVTELHSHQLSQVLERQRELYQELDRRVTEALKTPVAPVVTSPVVTEVGETPSYSRDLTENEAYDRALNMVLKEKRYAEAIPEFRAFTAKYPKSTYSANAHYWLGQLLYNKGEYSAADKEFYVVVSQHEASNKRSDAMLKMAMVAQKLNNLAKAKEVYQKLVDEYPDSNSAKLALSRLKALSQ